MKTTALWLTSNPPEPDTHVVVRGHFLLNGPERVEIRSLGVSWYEAFIDGDWLTCGPARFTPAHPEYDAQFRDLAAGPHVIAAHLHYAGVETRPLPNLPAFWWCDVLVENAPIPITWRGAPLAGFRAQTRRINPILGWIEWCDTRENPEDWHALSFDDRTWPGLCDVEVPIANPRPPTIGNVQRVVHDLTPASAGLLANTFGGPLDDIPTRFFLRALDEPLQPVEGVWRRYDLGRVRLGCPSITLDVPAGTEVELAYSESLNHDRVVPYINWSCGPSCNLDHYVARGGPQTFQPLTPRGGRFIEVHVLAAPDQVSFVDEAFLERVYYGEPLGELRTSVEQFDRIWTTGVDTLRACSEDAITDNPTRERGQWIGDSVSVGLEIGAVAYGDLRLFRRALRQAAQCANADGLVAGLCPGTSIWLASYACHWTCACVRYHELTGEHDLLGELYPAAVRNVLAFEPHLTPNGLENFSDWVFIDWGYGPRSGPTNLVFDLMYLAALRAMLRWSMLIDDGDHREQLSELAARVEAIATRQIRERLAGTDGAESGLDVHQATWALRLGLLPRNDVDEQIGLIKSHIASCFPFDPDGPRLRDPFSSHSQVITPFFAHFILPTLVEHGEMDFVLEVIRRCWGWMLDVGLTTWAEVFDTRWSHCHEWSGTPTWLLSRYLLGLNPRFDLGDRHFELNVVPGTCSTVSGRLPIVGTDNVIDVEWQRDGNVVNYRARVAQPITVHVNARHTGGETGVVAPSTQLNLELRVQ